MVRCLNRFRSLLGVHMPFWKIFLALAGSILSMVIQMPWPFVVIRGDICSALCGEDCSIDLVHFLVAFILLLATMIISQFFTARWEKNPLCTLVCNMLVLVSVVILLLLYPPLKARIVSRSYLQNPSSVMLVFMDYNVYRTEDDRLTAIVVTNDLDRIPSQEDSSSEPFALLPEKRQTVEVSREKMERLLKGMYSNGFFEFPRRLGLGTSLNTGEQYLAVVLGSSHRSTSGEISKDGFFRLKRVTDHISRELGFGENWRERSPE